MSQLLRTGYLCQRLIFVTNARNCNLLRCWSCERNWHRHNLRFDKAFSIKTATFAQKYGEKSKKVRKKISEHSRQEHFRDLLTIMEKAKTQYYAGGSSQQRKEHSTDSGQSKTSIIDETLKSGNPPGSNKHQQQESKQTRKKKSKTKTHLEFDAKKPILNEAMSLGCTDLVPQVKTLYGSKLKSKDFTKKKLTVKQKKKVLARLLASHPFVEHMQSGGGSEVNPLVISELENILQTDSVNPELSHMIQEYLEKAQVKNVTEDSMEELDDTSQIQLPEPSKPLWTESDLKDPELLKEVISNVVKVFMKDVSQAAKQKAIKMDAQRQLDMFHREVAAFVDACIYIGNLGRAHQLLVRQTQKKKKKGRRKKLREVTDINIFNKLMHAYAKQGKLQSIRQLFRHIEGNNIEVNLQSYAAVLECLGRSKRIPNDIVEKVLQDIERKGFHISDLCHSCVLQKDEWNYIEKAIKSVNTDFNVNLASSDDLEYKCNLLNALNTAEKHSPNPYHGILTIDELNERAKKQLNLELGGNIMVESIQPSVRVTSPIKKARKLLELTQERWRSVLRQGFLQAVEQLEQKKHDEDHLPDLLPFLKLFPAKIYVDIMMQELTAICQEMESYSPPMVLIHNRLGHNVFNKLQLIIKQKQNQVQKMALLYEEYLEHYSKETLDSNLRQIMQQLQNKYADGSSLVVPLSQWPVSTCKSIGRFLMSVIMSEVKVNASMLTNTQQSGEIPAFYSITRSRNNVPQEEVMPHPVLVRLHKMAELRQIQFSVADMPSLVPPMPWTSVNFGGNILCTTNLIKNAPPQFNVHEKVENQQLYPLFDALNTVSSVPWIINKPMLDVLIEVFNSGGDPKLDIPQPVSKLKPLPVFKTDMTPEERTAVILERLKLKKKRKEMYSLWCTELYRLSIANKYRDEVFWFPHNVDFRSRFYAVPPHFNHLGSDVARSLLVFAKGKELGEKGLDWLKIHLINLTGFKKRSPNRERLQFANENIDKILDSADNPLTGEKWWQESDEPWQTLACCKEIANVIRSPDPTKYISHYPVHQDGSCNGLQHYAALGRDLAGAQSVNLYPFDSPKDVYSDVVELVEQERKADAAAGKSLAHVLEGFVRRKVIKQTIMTTVYGVTKYGARQQIRRQLEDMSDFPQEHVWASMAYLTDKTFYCLQQMFTSTKQIQDWLVACAELTSRVCYEPVKWVTPVGWPVLQPYYKHSYMSKPDQPERKIAIEKPNAMKQKNAFPPNFIHSLDSTHMMLTAIQCFRKGATFVAVHDCFWTHACDIDLMNKDCREQFVALHKEPILENLADFLLQEYGFPENEMKNDDKLMMEAKLFINRILSNLPERGTFDIDKVLESTYFFS